MPEIRADAIAVYVYRRIGRGVEFLQIRRSGETGEYQHSWQTVYGGVELLASGMRETAVQAAVRELREETGLAGVKMWQVEYLESFYLKPHHYVLVMPVFAVEVAPDAAVVLNAEHNAWRWVPEAEIAEKFMWRTQREALTYLLAELQNPSQARPFLEVSLF